MVAGAAATKRGAARMPGARVQHALPGVPGSLATRKLAPHTEGMEGAKILIYIYLYLYA